MHVYVCINNIYISLYLSIYLSLSLSLSLYIYIYNGGCRDLRAEICYSFSSSS